MYRYLLFTYFHYYPAGGMEDCIYKTNNFDAIDIFIKENREFISEDNLYIYDVKKDEIIDLV